MTIEFTQDKHFVAFWVLGLSKMGDVMGAAWLEKDSGRYRGKMRIRKYDPEDPDNDAFSGKDQKDWYAIDYGTERPDFSEQRQRMEALGNMPDCHLIWYEPEGEEGAYLQMVEWLKKQPFANMQVHPVQ